jgi:threonine dehydratase
MVNIAGIRAAAALINGEIQRTPLTHDDSLQAILKWENQQVTGSFKARGAINALKCLSPRRMESGIVAVSAGNHGQGVALAAARAGIKAQVFLPQSASEVKAAAIWNLGAELHFVPGGYEQAEIAAIDYAREKQLPFISPYDDEAVVCGQGTIGLEMVEKIDLERYTQVVVPVGGGGLIAGIGAVMRASHPRLRLIGAQAAGSPFMHALWHNNPQEEVVETIGLADGLEGMVAADSLTIPLVRQLVDDIVLISEEGIRAAIRYAWQKHHQKIEGSAAVALAALLDGKIKSVPTAVVISGGNILPHIFNEIVAEPI